jgi:putative phosphoesterase
VTLRVCILSDTHGELDARIAELASSCAITIHGGDVGCAAVLDSLRAAGTRLIAVRGNNDVPAKWPPSDYAELAALPSAAQVALPGGVLAVEHGHAASPARLRHERLRTRHPQARAIVYGHSHRLVCDLDQRPWVLNPGAAGRSRTFGGPSCLLLCVTSTRRWQLESHRFPLAAKG